MLFDSGWKCDCGSARSFEAESRGELCDLLRYRGRADSHLCHQFPAFRTAESRSLYELNIVTVEMDRHWHDDHTAGRQTPRSDAVTHSGVPRIFFRGGGFNKHS